MKPEYKFEKRPVKENELEALINIIREFDPGSGRTLAACLTHASRTEIRADSKVACYRTFLCILVADGRVTRE